MLTQEEVDEFLAAAKRVRNGPMVWKEAPEGSTWARALEVDDVAVATIFLWVSRHVERTWQFKLRFAQEEVYLWHVRSAKTRHSNDARCPGNRGFHRKVKCKEHEHLWIEGLDCRCAKALRTIAGLSHEHTLAKFCETMRIDFEPLYRSPESFEQLSIYDEPK